MTVDQGRPGMHLIILHRHVGPDAKVDEAGLVGLEHMVDVLQDVI